MLPDSTFNLVDLGFFFTVSGGGVVTHLSQLGFGLLLDLAKLQHVFGRFLLVLSSYNHFFIEANDVLSDVLDLGFHAVQKATHFADTGLRDVNFLLEQFGQRAIR